MNIPILRIELEGMKQSLMTALSTHATEINKMVEKAVDEYCTEENLHSVIFTQARQIIDQAVKDEIQSFYLYGEGRKVIREAIIKQLSEE